MPFHNRGERSLEEILEFIEANNKHPKYRSDEFTIQQGIERILLTPENKKFDLRTYGLVVWEVGDIEDVGDQSRDGSRDCWPDRSGLPILLLPVHADAEMYQRVWSW